MSKYKGWEPEGIVPGSNDALKWEKIRKWANKEADPETGRGPGRGRVKPRVSLVQSMWQNYKNKKVEEGGGIARTPPRLKPVSPKDYLEEIKRRKKEKKNGKV